MWCQEVASLLCICLPPAMPLREVSSWWLKSPPIMVLSESNSALLMAFHKRALFLEVWVAYTLIIISVPLPAACNLINYARPSIKIPLSTTKGAVLLSTRMAVPALILWEGPMGIPGFQKEPPFQYSIPFPELLMPSWPKWCSWMRRIWGGREERLTRVWSPSALANWSLIL